MRDSKAAGQTLYDLVTNYAFEKLLTGTLPDAIAHVKTRVSAANFEYDSIFLRDQSSLDTLDYKTLVNDHFAVKKRELEEMLLMFTLSCKARIDGKSADSELEILEVRYSEIVTYVNAFYRQLDQEMAKYVRAKSMADKIRLGKSEKELSPLEEGYLGLAEILPIYLGVREGILSRMEGPLAEFVGNFKDYLDSKEMRSRKREVLEKRAVYLEELSKLLNSHLNEAQSNTPLLLEMSDRLVTEYKSAKTRLKPKRKRPHS